MSRKLIRDGLELFVSPTDKSIRERGSKKTKALSVRRRAKRLQARFAARGNVAKEKRKSRKKSVIGRVCLIVIVSRQRLVIAL